MKQTKGYQQMLAVQRAHGVQCKGCKGKMKQYQVVNQGLCYKHLNKRLRQK